VTNIPDGLTVTFISPCRYGMPGEVKTLSYSTAKTLIRTGYARECKGPVVVSVPTPRTDNMVTVICPTYNRRKYIPSLISCFLSQTYINSELVIVDDGPESAEDLIPAHSRIRYVRLPDGPALTCGAKRNVCCTHARGEIIVHFDDDDWQAPTRIADQVAQLQASKKQVLSYYNILYWNEDTQKVYRCWPQKMRAAHGASLCYRKNFWKQNPFWELPDANGVPGGEDTKFGQAAFKLEQFVLADARAHMVLRAHKAENGSSGNVSSTADSMGSTYIPMALREDIPPAFFSEPSLSRKTSMDDLVVSVAQGQTWTQLFAFANSLVRTGFDGTRLLLVNSLPDDARRNLEGLGFKLRDIPRINNRFTDGRHDSIFHFLEEHRNEFRYAVWVDTRDLVFQENPSTWLEANLLPHRLIGASECWLAKNQHHNEKWLRETVSAEDYVWLREMDVCCGGTLAGDACAVYEALAAVRGILSKVPQGTDQAALNYVLRTSPVKEYTRIPKMKEGWAATASAFNTGGFRSYSAGPPLTDTAPLFDLGDATVYVPGTRTPFCVLHQYDRDPRWTVAIERKYS